MTINHIASTIKCDAGPNTLPGPTDITGLQCTGAVTISKSGTTIMTFAAGTFNFELRSAGPLVVTGACTLLLRLSRHD